MSFTQAHRVYSRGLLVLLAFGIMSSARAPRLQAAPVTLRFEATVGPPRTDTFPIDLPFSWAEGDSVTGSFTFEPVDVPPNVEETMANQSLHFNLLVDSFSLQAPSYRIWASDNSISDEAPAPIDRIVLQSLAAPMSVDDTGVFNWSFSATFNGLPSVLDGADVPSGVAIWSKFLPGSLGVSFQDTRSGRGTGFVATVDSFYVVPEPGVIKLLAGLFLLPLTLFRNGCLQQSPS